MIKVNKLVKKFKDFTAVNEASFEIGENKVVGFLGPNGAGKTTTIRMLVGLSKPTSGEISICNEKVIFGNQTNEAIGYLPEQPSFYSWMTGEEYLNFSADIFGLSVEQKEKRIGKLLKLVNLLQAKDKRISSYSNGMRQRLGIAQALVNNPKVLILDEPVSALDPIGRREVLEIIENLKQDTTILLSTHILADVDKICDEVIIIKEGNILAVSPLATLKQNFAQPLIEVQFNKDPFELVDALKKKEWVSSVEKSGNTLRVWIRDKEILDSNLPLNFFAESKIGVLQYGLRLPETEDLFINLINK